MPTAVATKPLSERIRTARTRSGKTLTQVAAEARVPDGTLWNWEHGRCVPSRSSRAYARVARTLALPKVAATTLR